MYSDYDSESKFYQWLIEQEAVDERREELVQVVAAPIMQLISVLVQIENQKRGVTSKHITHGSSCRDLRTSRQLESVQSKPTTSRAKSNWELTEESWKFIIVAAIFSFIMASCAFSA